MLDSEKGVDAKLYVWVYDHHIAEGDGFRPADDRDELVEEPRDRTRYLEEESCRKTHLLAALECIPAIEAPQAAPGSPEVGDGTHGQYVTSAEAAGAGLAPTGGAPELVEEDIRAVILELVLTGVAAISGVIAAIVSAKQLRLAQARRCHGRRSDSLPTSRASEATGLLRRCRSPRQ